MNTRKVTTRLHEHYRTIRLYTRKLVTVQLPYSFPYQDERLKEHCSNLRAAAYCPIATQSMAGLKVAVYAKFEWARIF